MRTHAASSSARSDSDRQKPGSQVRKYAIRAGSGEIALEEEKTGESSSTGRGTKVLVGRPSESGSHRMTGCSWPLVGFSPLQRGGPLGKCLHPDVAGGGWKPGLGVFSLCASSRADLQWFDYKLKTFA